MFEDQNPLENPSYVEPRGRPRGGDTVEKLLDCSKDRGKLRHSCSKPEVFEAIRYFTLLCPLRYFAIQSLAREETSALSKSLQMATTRVFYSASETGFAAVGDFFTIAGHKVS